MPVAMKRILIRVPSGLNDRIQKTATAESNNVSAVTRRLLTKALDQEDDARARTRHENRRP